MEYYTKKIIWITNVPLNAVKKKLGKGMSGTGTWYDNLLINLVSLGIYKFYVISPYPKADFSFEESSVVYYSINNPISINSRKEQTFLKKAYLIIKAIEPDLIHIHGTEKISGLLDNIYGPLNIPIIISIQGLTGPIFKTMFPKFIRFHMIIFYSNLSLISKIKRHLDQTGYFISLFNSGIREKNILMKNKYFFGRTEFDKTYLKLINQDSFYFQEPRILREVFYHERWSINHIDKYSIILLNIRGTNKSAETAINAICTLIKQYPNLKLRIAGINADQPYTQYLLYLSKKRGVLKNVELLGYLDEYETINWLKRSHLFCLTSLIENSPNTLAEAQIIGMPCIAHIVGGVQSYIENECSLTYENDNYLELASKINVLFSDDNYAVALGLKAYSIAQKRHNKSIAINCINDTYLRLINESTKNKAANV